MSDAIILDADARSSTEAMSSANPVASGRATDMLFMLGLLTLPLQTVQIGPAQPGQVWMLITLPFMIRSREVKVSPVELFAFLAFIGYAVAVTVLGAYPRIKAPDQILKFAVIYPGLYYVGRGFGSVYARRAMPAGYGFLVLLLAFEILVEVVKPPYIYQRLDFAEGALHGTFKERNWLGLYFLMLSYFIFEVRSDRAGRSLALFLILNVVVTYFTGSKTNIVACALVMLLRARIPLVLKVSTAFAGALIYWQFFSTDLSGARLRERMEDERGLAYAQSMLVLSRNLFGYGFGYVEAYFGQLAVEIRGLGAGTNSVFCSPIDLMIIAGFVGVGAWLVFFCGIGLGATSVLAPIAALSLLNPLHQSEIAYLFLGMLVSGAVLRRAGPATDLAARGKAGDHSQARIREHQGDRPTL